MKRVICFVGCLLVSCSIYAQSTSNMHIVINSDNTLSPMSPTFDFHTYQDLTPHLAGPGIQMSNISIDSFGKYKLTSVLPVTLGMFVFLGSSDIGMDTGLVLTTGVAPNVSNNQYHPIPDYISGICWPAFYNTGMGYPGGSSFGDIFPPDSASAPFRWEQFPDLVNLNNGNPIADPNVLDFDFVPQYNEVQLQYVFASEEYPNFDSARYPTNYPATVCDSATDVMGIFLSGPGITGEKNIALIPGTDIPVGINTITPSGWSCDGKHDYSQYYVDNSSGQNVIFNGFTTVLTAKSAVSPGLTYHLRIGVADGAPHNELPSSYNGIIPRRSFYDSGIFLKFGSLISTQSTDTSGTDSTGTGIVNTPNAAPGVQVYPNPFKDHFQLQTNDPQLQNEDYQLTLNDLPGQRICVLNGTISQINSGLSGIRFNTLAPGVYYLSLKNRQTGTRYFFKLSKMQ